MFKPSTLFYTDGYKPGHNKMLAKGTTRLYGTWIPRNLKYAPSGITKVVSFGQQLTWRWIHDEFEENFFMRNQMNNDKNYNSDYYKKKALSFVKDMSLYLNMEYDGKHFEKLWDLGYLPIKVKALPEGIETEANIPHMTFINTVNGFAWLTLYLETIVSSLAWKPSTSATIALQYRRNALKWVTKTDPQNLWLVDYMCHDFSARGLSPWDMFSSGLGHATSHRGSDTLIAIPGARYFYDEPENEVIINSVNASEHSVSTTKIFTVGEKQMLSDWMKDFPKGILSVVADTFDLWKLITEYLPALKDEIMARDGKLVIRPDSGDPVDIICGKIQNSFKSLEEVLDFLGYFFHETTQDKSFFTYNASVYSIERDTIEEFQKEYGSDNTFNFGGDTSLSDIVMGGRYSYITKEKVSINEAKGVIELLWDIFGGKTNEYGYKELDSHVGAIYGDSITLERQEQIYKRLAAKGFAATNIVLGVGLT